MLITSTDTIFETGTYGVPSKSQPQPFWIKGLQWWLQWLPLV